MEPFFAITLPLHVERIAEEQLCGPLEAQWQALHDGLTPRVPFTSPRWNILWWKHYRSDRPTVRDELFLLAVRDANGTLVAVAPMMSTERPSVGPVRMRTLRCFGADPNVTELRGIVCRPEHQVAALLAIRHYVLNAERRWDWIEWGALRHENWTGVAEVVPGGMNSAGVDVHDYYLELPGTWEELRGSRSRNIKESLRKCYNSLKRDGLVPELRALRAPAQVAEGLDTFFRLHSARSLSDAAVAHADVFNAPNAREFLRYYATELAERDQLRIFQLVLAGQVVATRIGFQLGDELYLYYSGYDPAFARYSVMTTLVAEALKWAIEQKLRVVNLSTGTDVSKTRWGPLDTRFRTLTEVDRNWRSILSFSAYRRAKILATSGGFGRIAGLVRR